MGRILPPIRRARKRVRGAPELAPKQDPEANAVLIDRGGGREAGLVLHPEPRGDRDAPLADCYAGYRGEETPRHFEIVDHLDDLHAPALVLPAVRRLVVAEEVECSVAAPMPEVPVIGAEPAVAAVGKSTVERRVFSMEGVHRMTDRKVQLFFVTIDKSTSDRFSPTTSYEDRMIVAIGARG